jgi:hypothetical protein
MRADHESPAGRAFPARFIPVADVSTGARVALIASVGWERSFGSLDLSHPEHLSTLVNRQAELAAEATRIALQRLKSVFDEANALGHGGLPIIIALPSVLLKADAGELALPNLVTPFLDRREAARTVILVDAVPLGGGQALRVLSDHGLHIALTAAAAAEADPSDLFGWQRWAILFPQHVVQGRGGVDGLLIQQTASAIATRDTRLIAYADPETDGRELARHNIHWVVDPGQVHTSVRESVGIRIDRPR